MQSVTKANKPIPLGLGVSKQKELLRYHFDPKTHTYTDNLGRPYISATTFISKFKKPFDTKAQAEAYAIKHGKTAEYWMKEWKRITDEACDYGSGKHNSLEEGVAGVAGEAYTNKWIIKGIEEYLKDVKAPMKLSLEYPTISNHILKLLDKGYIPVTEKRIFHEGDLAEDELIAGTPDLAFFKKKDFIIDDYKTNKDKLRDQAGYYKKVGGVKTNEFIYNDARLLPPLLHLQDSKKVLYELQINLYAYMLIQKGYNWKGGTIHHLQRDMTVISYPVRDFQKEIKMMIKHYFNVIVKGNEAMVSNDSFGL